MATTEQQLAAAYNDPLLGQRIGNYLITRQIGEGGMGAVYEARNEKLGGKRFAIKVMLPEYALNVEVVERFVREALAAARVDHPRIITVLDCDTIQGRPYQIMPLLEGRDLTAHLQATGIATPFGDNRRLPLVLAAPFLFQIFDGIAALHAQQIVHRDIKGGNVFIVASDQSVKILDFGIAKLADPLLQLSALTGARRVVGTVGYMAPEQASCGAIDHRADIWALGALMYRMLTGRLPFLAPDYVSFIIAVQRTAPPSPAEFVPALPAAVCEVILACLRLDRTQRPPTVRALCQALMMAMPEGRRIARAAAPTLAAVSAHDELTLLPLPELTDFAAAAPRTVLQSAAAPSPSVRMHRSVGKRTAIIAGLGVASALVMAGAAYHLGARQSVSTSRIATADAEAVLRMDAAQVGAAVVVAVAYVTPDARPVDALGLDAPQIEALMADASVPPAVDAATAVAMVPMVDAARKKVMPVAVVKTTPQVSPRAPVAAAVPAGRGRLTVAVTPWALLTLDGKDVGQTPYTGELAAGPHILKLTNRDVHKSEVVRIIVKPDAVTELRRNW